MGGRDARIALDSALALAHRGSENAGDVVRHLIAMQAQEHTYARWSVAQRTTGTPAASAIERAFDEGRFLRTHLLRPTRHFVAATDLRGYR
jgi:hypothetical protein